MATTPIVDILADIAQVARQAPTSTLIRAYVRAARKFCHQSRWLRYTITGQTEAGVQLYSLGTDPDLEVIGLKAVSSASLTGNTQPYPLRVSVPTGWLPDQPNGAPVAYAYVPEGQVAFNPTPNAVYNLTLTLVAQPVLGCNSLPSEMLVRWDQTLQAGALEYLYGLPGQPWSSPQLAQIEARKFQSGIANARADEQRDFNVGTFIARKRPFVVGSM
jgi:hypothetical protein